MKNLILLTVLTFLLLVAARPGVADVIEIPLDLPTDPLAEGLVAFDAGMPLPDIATVKLVLVGIGGGQGYIGCNAPYPWTYGVGNGELDITLQEFGSGTFLRRISLGFGDGEKAPFTRTENFPEADFAPLESGRGQLEFDNPAHMFLSGIYWICPTGHACLIESATLVVEYGDIVAVDGHTWGALKAIYR